MTADAVASLDHVTKEFRLRQERSNARRLIPGRWGESRGAEMFRALDDVSFSVGPGEAMGLIGHNGAGKSTVLRLLARIMEPSDGVVRARGRVASIIELGVGFDPNLTGRESIGFAAEMIGLSRQEVADNLDWMIDFSGLEDFLEMPVRRYSTGMAARLGFAIATAVRPDLLLVDEVLSVGDYAFQQKSLERIKNLHREGSALVLVSHSNWLLGSLCDRLILLERGRVVEDGPPAKVIGIYIGPEARAEDDPEVPAADYLEYEPIDALRGVVEIDELEAVPPVIRPNDSVTLRATITVRRPINGLVVLSLFTAERAVFAEREAGPSAFLSQPGTWRIEAQIQSVPLGVGRFQLRMAVLPEDDPHHEQQFHGAVAVASTGLEIDGGPSARPGLKLNMIWTEDPLDLSDH